MTPVYFRPGFNRPRPMHDLTGTLIVSVLLLAIVVGGLSLIITGAGS